MSARRAAGLAFALALLARTANGGTQLVIVGGLGGAPEYEQRFAAQAGALAELGRGLTADPHAVRVLSGAAATREALRRTLAEAARQSAPGDSAVFIAIGHGTVDGGEYKLNLPGPDPTCAELRQWLDAVPARRQLVVLATSAGGACVEPLARAGRVVLSATRSGTERNAPVFARYFVEALRDPGADTDHDDAITALEVFRYAEQKVQRFYADEKRLATEHPRMEGDDARTFVLLRRGAAARRNAGDGDPALLARKEQLEEAVRDLKARKATLARDAYLDELERILLDLARTEEALDPAPADAPR
jgi:hypothetical protein